MFDVTLMQVLIISVWIILFYKVGTIDKADCRSTFRKINKTIVCYQYCKNRPCQYDITIHFEAGCFHLNYH